MYYFTAAPRISPFFALLCLYINPAFGQTGTTCTDAIPLTSTATCAFSTQSISGAESWVSFTANTQFCDIEVVTTKFGINAPHVHGVELYEGTCSNLQLIGKDELPFCGVAEKLSIDLDGGNLQIGSVYYIKLSREASGYVQCDKGSCYPALLPASYDICIQGIDILIPPDLMGEPPSMAHAFYQNRGQLLNTSNVAANDLMLYTLNASPGVFLSEQSTSLVFGHIGPIQPYEPIEGAEPITTGLDALYRVDVTMIGSNPLVKTLKVEQSPGALNYFIPHAPSGIINNRGFYRAIRPNVYPKIDQHFYSNGAGLKMYFVVNSGGVPSDITIQFNGASSIAVANGAVTVNSPYGSVEFEPPHAYQLDGSGSPVPLTWSAQFIDVGNNTVKFSFGEYDMNKPVIFQVDQGGHNAAAPPAVDNMLWSSYWGQFGNDYFKAIAHDLAGNPHYAGETQSFNFPVSSGTSFPYNGAVDAIVIKLNSGIVPQWINFFGGSDGEQVNDIDVNSNGKVYFCGRTSSIDMPYSSLSGLYLDSLHNPDSNVFYDAYIASFSADGSVLEWATYYGGNGFNENIASMALDGANNLYAVGTGVDGETDLDTQSGAFNSTIGSGLILKFDAFRNRTWATTIGTNSQSEDLKSIEADANNNVYITGSTGAQGFPTVSAGAPIFNTFSGERDIVIFKLDGPTNNLQWSTYWGGSELDRPFDLALDEQLNRIFVVGQSRTSDTDPIPLPLFEFNTQSNSDYFQSQFASTVQTNNVESFDAIIAGLDMNTNAFDWATYYGGYAEDGAYGVFVDDNSYVYVVGSTRSGIDNNGASGTQSTLPLPQFPPTGFFINDNLSDVPAFTSDGFITVFTPELNLGWTTYYGRGNQVVSESVIDVLADVSVFGDDMFVGGYTGEFGPQAQIPLSDYNPLTPAAQGPDIYYDIPNNGSECVGALFKMDDQTILNTPENQQTTTPDVLVYPNPSKGIYTIEVLEPTSDPIQITLYDVVGKIIFDTKSDQHSSTSFEIDITHYQTGIYILEIEGGNQKMIRKLIKH